VHLVVGSEVPLLILAFMAPVHVDVVIVHVVVSTLVVMYRFQRSAIKIPLLVAPIVAWMEINVTIVVVVVQALLTMSTFHSASKCRIRWTPEVEHLILARVAIVHVDVIVAGMIVQTLVSRGPDLEVFALEVPLLICAPVTLVHVNVAVAVHVEA